MACRNDGVCSVLPHRDSRSSSTVRKMIVRSRASGCHRQPRVAVFVRESPCNHFPRAANGATSTSFLDDRDAICRWLKGDDFTSGPYSCGEQFAVEADVCSDVPDAITGTNACKHRRPETLLVSPVVSAKRQGVY